MSRYRLASVCHEAFLTWSMWTGSLVKSRHKNYVVRFRKWIGDEWFQMKVLCVTLQVFSSCGVVQLLWWSYNDTDEYSGGSLKPGAFCVWWDADECDVTAVFDALGIRPGCMQISNIQMSIQVLHFSHISVYLNLCDFVMQFWCFRLALIHSFILSDVILPGYIT